MSEPCDHKFVLHGTITWPSSHTVPGSGAHARIYADYFYCERCCTALLRNEREMGTTYQSVRNGAVEYPEKPT